MHIMEGYLPSPWWQIWFALSIPVIMYGIYKLNRLIKENREMLPLLAVAGAFIFVLSALKLPSSSQEAAPIRPAQGLPQSYSDLR